MSIPLCSSCYKTVSTYLEDVVEVDVIHNCVFCFGLMDSELYKDIVKEAEIAFDKEGLDGNTFVLAVNFPVSQHFREKLIEKLIGNKWIEQEMSPKSRSTFVMMHTFRQVCLVYGFKIY